MTMNDTLGRLLVSAKMLYANAEGCAINHYGEDFALHGLPGWLADCRSDISAAEAALASRTPAPQPGGAVEDAIQEVERLVYGGQHDGAASLARACKVIRSALEPSPSGWNAGAEAMREACAAAIGPVGERPCDCERCDCRNRDDAERVARWDEAKACAEVIRALPLPTPPAGEG